MRTRASSRSGTTATASRSIRASIRASLRAPATPHSQRPSPLCRGATPTRAHARAKPRGASASSLHGRRGAALAAASRARSRRRTARPASQALHELLEAQGYRLAFRASPGRINYRRSSTSRPRGAASGRGGVRRHHRLIPDLVARKGRRAAIDHPRGLAIGRVFRAPAGAAAPHRRPPPSCCGVWVVAEDRRGSQRLPGLAVRTTGTAAAV
jgi:hypothetical protein